jgi:hypothetical protein
VRLEGAVLDQVLAEHRKALEGDGLIRQNTLFATTTLPIDNLAIADGSNVVYRIKPRLDGQGQGRYLDHYKNSTVEGEVMYPAYSQFRVQEVRVIDPGNGTPPTKREKGLQKIAIQIENHEIMYGRRWREYWEGPVPSDAKIREAEETRERLRQYRPPQIEIYMEEP